MDPIFGATQGVPAHLLHDDVTVGPKAKNILGKDDFMQLLMTQLQHQDPLNPMDHKEMSTSLAQFGSLEQLTNIGTGIQSLKSGMTEGSKLGMLSLIGKTIEASGNEIKLREGEPLILSHITKEGVVATQVDIFDSEGKSVRRLQLTGREQGGKVGWDGMSDDGKKLASGSYTYRVSGVDGKGMGVDLSSNIKGKVTGMDMAAATPQLLVTTEAGEMTVELNRVRSVNTEGEKAVASIPKADKMKSSPPAATTPVLALASVDGDDTEASGSAAEDSVSLPDFGSITLR